MQSSALMALSYAFMAMPYIVAVVLGFLVPMLVVLCYSRFGVGMAVIVGMFALEALYMFVGGITLGVSLFYNDFALVFAFVAGLLRWVWCKDRPRIHRSWLVYSGAVFLSLVVGLAMYGTGAGVQARPYFYFTAAAMYGMSFEINSRRARLLLNALVGVAVLLLFITSYRWLVYYTPITSLLPEDGNYNNDGPIRVIRSHEALVLAQVLVVAIFFAGASRGMALARVLSPLLLGAVLVLQHRSVWVAALAGLLTSILVGRLQRGSALAQGFLLVAIVAVTSLPIFLSDSLSGITGQIKNSAGNALEERGSAGERVTSWTEIVNNWAKAGPRSIVIGQSFGTDPSRYVHDDKGAIRKLTYTAHNMYVQTLFNAGLLGLGAFLVAAAYVVRGLYRMCAAGQDVPQAQALLVLVIMQLVYYVPYGTDYLQSLIFGIALSYVAGHQALAKPGEQPVRAKRVAGRLGWS